MIRRSSCRCESSSVGAICGGELSMWHPGVLRLGPKDVIKLQPGRPAAVEL